MKRQTQVLRAFLANTMVMMVLLYIPIAQFAMGLLTGTWVIHFFATLTYFVKVAKIAEKRLTNQITNRKPL